MRTVVLHITLVLSLIFVTVCRAQSHSNSLPLSETARIALLTCAPGDELYARYGHTAILVADAEQDIQLVYNYGIFDFNTDLFYWKFVRGETWYELGCSDATFFAWQYREEQRPVYVQWLNLTQPQKQALWDALQINYLPENRRYLYNFVFDNCATRPYHLIREAVGGTIISPYHGADGQSFRHILYQYTGRGTWSDLGTNLLFGPRADRKMQGEDVLFLPEQLMFYMQHATLPDGTPIVAEGHTGRFRPLHTPWYATWYFGAGLFALCMALLSLYDSRRGRRSRWADYTCYGIYALLCALVFFLRFFSIHPLVGFGPYLLIFPTIHLCTRLIYILPRMRH